MKLVRFIVSVVTTIMLAFTFVGAGFAVCAMSPIAHGLSWVFATDSVSPFDRGQLAQVADATRDYSFGNHDLLRLYQTIYSVDVEYRDDARLSAISAAQVGFPKIDQITDITSVSQYRDAFNGASELYCYSQDTISHLDDCYGIARFAFPAIIAALILSLAGIVFTGVTGKKRRVGFVFLFSGILLIVVFVALAIFAILDFDTFFTTFHQIFFRQGNWTFPYDSLLICALPTMFWASMGVVWLAVSVLAAIIAMLLGSRFIRRSKRQKPSNAKPLPSSTT